MNTHQKPSSFPGYVGPGVKEMFQEMHRQATDAPVIDPPVLRRLIARVYDLDERLMNYAVRLNNLGNELLGNQPDSPEVAPFPQSPDPLLPKLEHSIELLQHHLMQLEGALARMEAIA